MKNVEEVSDNILLVLGEKEGKFPYSHSILILDEEKVLIDTGCGIETLKRIRVEYDVKYIINSHTHPDHSAGNWVFERQLIYVPVQGFESSGDINILSERFAGKSLAQVWQVFVRDKMEFKNCRPTHQYHEQTVFNFGKTTLKPLYTPGHTKDHYCLYEEKERILFSFDYDLTAFPWYGHKESDLSKFIESVKKLKTLNPKIVVSSHRGIITKKINVEFDKFLRRIEERDERILSLLENRKTVNELLKYSPIYGKFPYAQPLLRYWESQMIEKHLERLQREGKVKRKGCFYFKI
jgi:glyoxylase-like metal-dependent hydrolase (beta-lactamase superfamily II)